MFSVGPSLYPHVLGVNRFLVLARLNFSAPLSTRSLSPAARGKTEPTKRIVGFARRVHAAVSVSHIRRSVIHSEVMDPTREIVPEETVAIPLPSTRRSTVSRPHVADSSIAEEGRFIPGTLLEFPPTQLLERLEWLRIGDT